MRPVGRNSPGQRDGHQPLPAGDLAGGCSHTVTTKRTKTLRHEGHEGHEELLELSRAWADCAESIYTVRAMRVYDIPLVSAVMGLVLGPIAEQQFRRTLAISHGDMSVLVTRPVCALLLFSSAAVLFSSRLLWSKEADPTASDSIPVERT